MLVYYLSIILIALVIAGVVLAKLHISKIVDNSKALICFVNVIFILGFIDILWGLTYYDCFGWGIIGHIISSSMFFSASSILCYGWLLYSSTLINDVPMTRREALCWFIPAAFANCLVILNLFNGKLFHMVTDVQSYERGPWYVAYRLIIDGYYLMVIIKAFIRYRKEKEKKKK